MPLAYSLFFVAFTVLLAQPTGAWAQRRNTASGISVAVFCSTDDALTVKLCKEVERSLRRSHDFLLSENKSLSTLRVRIPTNVDWERADGQVEVRYRVEFWSSGDVKKLGEVAGTCREARLSDCAKQILLKAKEVEGSAARN